jgi:hypothetical protein
LTSPVAKDGDKHIGEIQITRVILCPVAQIIGCMDPISIRDILQFKSSIISGMTDDIFHLFRSTWGCWLFAQAALAER